MSRGSRTSTQRMNGSYRISESGRGSPGATGSAKRGKDTNMEKTIKVEWCENFIKARFTKHHAFPGPNAGIEVNCFWKMAELSGLWERGTYGTPMSKALGNITTVETVRDEDGKRLFDVFKLKEVRA